LACHHKPGQADRNQSQGKQTPRHRRAPVLNERLEFKHSFEKKARRARGKYVTFFGAALLTSQAAGAAIDSKSLSKSAFSGF
jgi:hypothetical protein